MESQCQEEKGFKEGGLGLGLSMARNLVEVMGGELQLESSPDKGSRFYFTLNLPPAREEVPVVDPEFENLEDALEEMEAQEEELDYSSVQLPGNMLAEIKKVVDLGMLDDMEEQLSEMEKIEPYGEKLAENLRGLADSFDTDGILEIIGKIKTI